MSNRFKNKFNIKKGDSVVVIAGDDKDTKTPKTVLKVLVDDGKIVVEGVNIVTKHTKPSAKNTQGGIVKQEAPINISNVQLWDAKSKTPTRVKRTRENGKLLRVSKKSGQKI